MGDTITAQLVGHETKRFLSLTLQESPEEAPCGTPVPTGLHEDIDHVAVLVHRPPEILTPTANRHEYFVQKPRVSELPLSSLQPPRVVGAELLAPLPDGLVRHGDAPFGEEVLYVPEAHAVSVVEPHGVADDLRQKAMP